MPPKPVTSLAGNLRKSGAEAVLEAECREVLDTFGMFLDGLEAQCNGTAMPSAPTGELANTAGVKFNKPPSEMEKLVLSLLDVRDDLAAAFSSLGAGGNKQVSDSLLSAIGKLEVAVQSFGAEVEPFKSIVHMTGLSASIAAGPLQNVKVVAARTKELYTMHKISKIAVGMSKNGRPGIVLTVAGEHGGKPFEVEGKVVAKTDFDGNEAVDYIKDDGCGHMSVKSPKLGRWVDASDKFDIAWRLVPVVPAPQNPA